MTDQTKPALTMVYGEQIEIARANLDAAVTGGLKGAVTVAVLAWHMRNCQGASFEQITAAILGVAKASAEKTKARRELFNLGRGLALKWSKEGVPECVRTSNSFTGAVDGAHAGLTADHNVTCKDTLRAHISGKKVERKASPLDVRAERMVAGAVKDAALSASIAASMAEKMVKAMGIGFALQFADAARDAYTALAKASADAGAQAAAESLGGDLSAPAWVSEKAA